MNIETDPSLGVGRKSASEIFEMLLNSRWVYIMLIIPAVLLYSRTLRYVFVNFDDNLVILNRESSGSYFQDILSAFNSVYLSFYYRPLISVSIITDCLLGGNAPWIYHFTNLCIHLCVVGLLFYTLSNLKFTKHTAFIVSIIFSIHPLTVQAESWILGRNDLMVALFVLLSFNLFIKLLENGKLLTLLFHLITLLFALLSKENAIGIVVVALIYFRYEKKLPLKSVKSIQIYTGWFIVLASWVIIRTVVLGAAIKSENPLTAFIYNLPLLLNVPAKIIFPVQLSPYGVYNLFLSMMGLACIIAGLLVMYIKKLKLIPVVIVGALWFLVFLVPSMFFRIDAYQHKFDYLECRTYLPLIGFSILLSAAIERSKLIENNKLILGSIFISAVIIYSGLSNSYIPVYSNPMTHWGAVTDKFPKRADGFGQIAWTKFMEGDYKTSIQYYQKAIALFPDNADYHLNLSLAYHQLGYEDEAVKSIMQNIKLKPRNPASYINLGVIAFARNDTAMAINYWRTALAFDSTQLPAMTSLAESYCDKNNLDSALYYANKIISRGGAVSEAVIEKITELKNERKTLRVHDEKKEL